mmetsp:Transcript_18929/g.35481  ORF Transcript_18929/g.35481 Transcript_18929/m.35481 type:complete len:452 (+) Transcript_18929:39-1394(+)
MGAQESVERVPQQVVDPDGKWMVGPPTPKAEDKDGVVAFGIKQEVSRATKSTSLAMVFVHELATGCFQDEFVVQLTNVADVEFWQGIRSRYDFECLHAELGKESGLTMIDPLPNRKAEYFKMQPLVWTLYMRESSALLQRWLNGVIDAGWVRTGSFKRFLSCQAKPHSAPCGWDSLPHMIFALPVMGDIVNYLEEPLDVVNLCEFTSKTIYHSSKVLRAEQWKRMYAERWPAFFEAQDYLSHVTHTEVDWKSMYRHTCAGKSEALLEVYDREKKLGFAMSCMLAKVTWDANTNCYITSYVSASQVLPERIPYHEGYRLRFCRPSAREQLKPELVPPQAPDLYGYRVMEDVPELKAGQGIELQWKMQQGSPFGWWFGTVESVARDTMSKKALVTMTFDHFPATSRWRRLQVTVGDGMSRPCAIGGWHGGVRAVTAAEKSEWAKFFPKEPVIF